MASLDRFRTAQQQAVNGFDAALAELQRGAKEGHWIWYVFPQLAGLGRSPTAETFAIGGRHEAEEYLEDPILGQRLLAIANVVAEQLRRGRPLAALMGSSLDAQKLVSSMTLFGRVAADLDARLQNATQRPLAAVAAEVLASAAEQGYPPCRHTLAALEKPAR